MSATIQLRKGDMFAQPSDLIVIPCSTAATVTGPVAQRLNHFDISPPQKAMRLGDVEFSIFKGASSVATYVAYAASVKGMGSSASAISSIAEKVALYANEKAEIRDVTLPLLGAGAGGLDAETSARAILAGLEKVQIENTVFNIYVLKPATFDALSGLFAPRRLPGPTVEGNKTPPVREAIRVFISYTNTNPDHQGWVRNLAIFLRENGIDARLDAWHLRPGMDAPQWMSNEIDLAERILIVCNEDYAIRANGRTGGVGWEVRLIQAELLQSQKDNPRKFIPIVRGEFDVASLPKFLRGVYAITWNGDVEEALRRQLLEELYGVYDDAPPIGSPPRFVLRYGPSDGAKAAL